MSWWDDLPFDGRATENDPYYAHADDTRLDPWGDEVEDEQ